MNVCLLLNTDCISDYVCKSQTTFSVNAAEYGKSIYKFYLAYSDQQLNKVRPLIMYSIWFSGTFTELCVHAPPRASNKMVICVRLRMM